MRSAALVQTAGTVPPLSTEISSSPATARVVVIKNVVPLISTVGASLVFWFVPVFAFS